MFDGSVRGEWNTKNLVLSKELIKVKLTTLRRSFFWLFERQSFRPASERIDSSVQFSSVIVLHDAYLTLWSPAPLWSWDSSSWGWWGLLYFALPFVLGTWTHLGFKKFYTTGLGNTCIKVLQIKRAWWVCHSGACRCAPYILGTAPR